MTIKTRLLACRKAKGLTLEQVGAAFATDAKPEGFGKAAVSAWEKGRNDLTLPQLIKLSELYGVTANYLLSGDDSALSEKERWLLASYRSVDGYGKRIISGGVDMALSLQSEGVTDAISPAIAKK